MVKLPQTTEEVLGWLRDRLRSELDGRAAVVTVALSREEAGVLLATVENELESLLAPEVGVAVPTDGELDP